MAQGPRGLCPGLLAPLCLMWPSAVGLGVVAAVKRWTVTWLGSLLSFHPIPRPCFPSSPDPIPPLSLLSRSRCPSQPHAPGSAASLSPYVGPQPHIRPPRPPLPCAHKPRMPAAHPTHVAAAVGSRAARL